MQFYISHSAQKGLVLGARWQVWPHSFPCRAQHSLDQSQLQQPETGCNCQKNPYHSLCQICLQHILFFTKRKRNPEQNKPFPILGWAWYLFFSWIISASVFVIWKKSTCVRCTLIRILAGVRILYRRSKVGEISFRFEASRTRLPKSSRRACQPYTKARLCLGVTGLAGPRRSISQVLCRTCMDASYKMPAPHPVLLRRDPANYT